MGFRTSVPRSSGCGSPSACSGVVFPRQDGPDRPSPREHLSQWIRSAEVEAKLPKLPGGTTRPYHREWRSERSSHPIMAVARAGAWTDIATMMLYDEPDDADVLAVTSEPRISVAHSGGANRLRNRQKLAHLL